LTVFDDTLSIERCQKELKDAEFSSVIAMVCYPNSKLIPKGLIRERASTTRTRLWTGCEWGSNTETNRTVTDSHRRRIVPFPNQAVRRIKSENFHSVT
jgi:hypothetical protein